MKHRMQEEAKVHATTGEVYTSYPLRDNRSKGVVARIFGWFRRQVNNHLDRTIKLRVYDNRSFNLAADPGGDR